MATSALVLRSQQSTPLSNSQLDGNFTYLNDRLTAKYDIIDFTAENISTALNTPAVISQGNTQTAIQLSESNSLDAWTLRTVAPSYLVPSITNKTSIPTRSQDGYIQAVKFIGDLEGNASTATNADSADEASSLSSTYTVPIERGGTGANTAQAARTALQVLHTGGLNSMTEKLQLKTSSPSNASVNFGQGTAPSTAYLQNGDMWIQSDGVYYRAADTTYKAAPTDSPTLTGQPKAPDADGIASQIATLSHIAATVASLNQAIALKSNVNSPNFTGTPQADTASQTVINRAIATTQYVHTAVNNKADAITTAYQTYTDDSVDALETSVNNALSNKANTNSPYLTGEPTAVTPTYPNDSQRIATTAYIKTAVDGVNQALATAIASLTALINDTRPVPTASVFHIASSVVPSGFLEANGQAVSRLTYPSLWAALGNPATTSGDPVNTFRIPDLRGEFIRGWDHGRGTDYGRALNSWQIGSLHIHNDEEDGFTGGVWNNMWNYGNGYVNNDAQYPRGNGHANEMGYDVMTFEWLGAYADTCQYNFSSNYPVFGGTYEWRDGTINLNTGTLYKSNHWIYMGRPRNVALMAIIKC